MRDTNFVSDPNIALRYTILNYCTNLKYIFISINIQCKMSNLSINEISFLWYIKRIVVRYTYLATLIECILCSYSMDLNKPIRRNIAKNIQNDADTSNDLDIQLTP